MLNTLTRDELHVIGALYRKYLNERKLGTQRVDAVMFGEAKNVKEILDITISDKDVDFILCSLDRKGYVDCLYGDNMVLAGYITDKTICEMEKVVPDAIMKGGKFVFDAVVQIAGLRQSKQSNQ